MSAPHPLIWGMLECPACHRQVPSFRLVEHRATCETKEEHAARLSLSLASLEEGRERKRRRDASNSIPESPP